MEHNNSGVWLCSDECRRIRADEMDRLWRLDHRERVLQIKRNERLRHIDRYKEYAKRYRQYHPEKMKENHEKWISWRRAHPEWEKNHRGDINGKMEYSLRWHNTNRNTTKKQYRTRLLKILACKHGMQCKVCGFNDIRFLEIDHINGGGNKDRRRFDNGNSKNIRSNYRYYVFMWQLALNTLQILCRYCNSKKSNKSNY